MNGLGESTTAAKIIGAVVEIVESEGYDAVQLRTVAKRARVSLTTIYQHYSNRDALILAAVEAWMADNSYTELSAPPPDEPLDHGLMRLIECVFQPWERSPRMAEAFYYARVTPGGHRLDSQGFEAVVPSAAQLLDGLDPDYVADIALVMINLCYAMVGRLVDGSADVPTILSSIERVLHRLTSDNSQLAVRRPATGAAGGLDAALFSPYTPRPGRQPAGAANPE